MVLFLNSAASGWFNKYVTAAVTAAEGVTRCFIVALLCESVPACGRVEPVPEAGIVLFGLLSCRRTGLRQVLVIGLVGDDCRANR